jgi:hypothetical protein
MRRPWLNIKFFMPYKGEDGHSDLCGFGDGKKAFFWQCPPARGTTFLPAQDLNTIRDTMLPM